MLLGLQQLFTSPKATQELGTKADQGLDLALLGDGENTGEFGEELLALLGKTQPTQSNILDQLTIQSPETGEIISQELAQKSIQSDDSMILEQVLENDGKKEEGPALKQLLTQASSKPLPTMKNTDRSPAIDFSPENIDKQLLNFSDFNQQKNLVKKINPQITYQGLEAKKGLDLKSTEVINPLATESGLGNLQSSPEFILNSMIDSQSSSNELNLNSVKAPAPIFDASQVKTADANVIIGQITDYIIQAKAAQEPTVNFKMNHQDLGQLDITVAKANAAEAVAINIGAAANEGKQFFVQNLKELSSHLASVGIQVSDIKVESSAQARSDFDFNQQQKHAESGQKQFGSEQNERRHEQERRQSLWDLLSNKEAA